MRKYSNTLFGQASRLALCLIFLAAVSTPLAGPVFYPAASRGLAEVQETLPALTPSLASARAWLAALRHGWLERNFPFRGELIRLDSQVSVRLLSSTLLSPVTMGRGDWLFLAKDRGHDLLEEHRAVRPLPEAEITALADELEARRAWLAARGIAYLLVIAPDKGTIYPEYLPQAYEKTAGPSYLDQTLAYLRQHTSLDIVDLKPAVLEAKQSHVVFYRTDTHWNAYGAYAGYLAAIARLETIFPGIAAQTMRQYHVTTTIFSGDQAKLLGVDGSMKEDFIQFFPDRQRSQFQFDYRTDPHYAKPAWASSRPDPGLPKAVILHDSYYVEQFLYFPDHFRHGVYAWIEPAPAGEFRFFDKALIESERPDIVIEEYAERYFRPAPPPEPAAAQEAMPAVSPAG
jgi:hypothetical protein